MTSLLYTMRLIFYQLISFNDKDATLQRLLLAILIVFSGSVYSLDNLLVSSDKIILESAIWYELEENDVVPVDKQSLTNWLKNKKQSYQPNRLGGRFVQLFEIENLTAHSAWVLDTPQHLVKTVNFHIFSRDEHIVIESGFAQTDEFFASYARRFLFEQGEKKLILVDFQSPEYNQTPKVTLWQTASFSDHNMSNRFWVVLLIGVIAALFIFTLFIGVGLTERTITCYSFYLLALCVAWLSRYELLNLVFGWQIYELIYTPFLLLPLLGGYFCVYFLRLDKYLPALAVVIKINGWLSFLVACTSPFYFEFANVLCSCFVIVWVFCALFAGYVRYKLGFESAKYFLLAFVWLSLPTAVMMPRNFGWIALDGIDIELMTLLGGALDAVFLAFALAHRETLNQANLAKLQTADTSKSQFLANMSHEIRTPLTSIIGYSDSILRNEISYKEQEDAIQIIGQNGQYLLSLINDILDLSKVEANKLEFQIEPTYVPDIYHNLERMLMGHATDKDIEFNVNFEFPIPETIEMDAIRFKQVLVNLVNNAIKFTDYGSVNIKVRYQNACLITDVEDTGIGMTALQQKQVFDPFFQAEADTHRRFGGTGLGLNIAKSFIEGMSGNVTLASEENKGSTFTVSLPVTHDVNFIHTSEAIRPAALELPKENVVIEGNVSKKVLLAEDNVNNRQLIAAILSSYQLEVIEAVNGEEAVDAIFEHDIGLVLMDIQMPVMDGIEAFTILKARGYLGPIVAITANTMKHEIDEYMSIGFDAHLSKPLDRERFTEVVGHYLTLKPKQSLQVTRGTVKDLVDDYLNTLPEILIDLTYSIKRQPVQDCLAFIHQHKGSAGSFGFFQMSDCLEQVEIHLKNNDRHQALLIFEAFIDFSIKYTRLQGIDLSNAIIAFDNNADDYLGHIEEAIMHCQNLIDTITEVEALEVDISLVKDTLAELQLVANDCFMTELAFVSAELLDLAIKGVYLENHELISQQREYLTKNLAYIRQPSWKKVLGNISQNIDR